MKRKLIFIFLFVILLLSCIFLVGKFNVNDKEKNVNIKNSKVIDSINVITNKDAKIYNLVDGKYKKVGTIALGEYIKLVDTNIIDDKYLSVSGFGDDYYIDVVDIDNSNDVIKYDDRYKKYIVFNENILTKDKTKFYNDKNELVYSFDFGIELPIIIKEEDRYWVEYNNRLLYVKVSEVDDVIEANNTDQSNTDGIRVLNYHSFYDENTDIECKTSICASDEQFKSHLDYLNNNHILTLKMKEVEMYIDGKIRLPKSVLITIDDGFLAEVGIRLLNDYKLYGTLFLITSLYKVEDFSSDYVEVHSHGDNIHNQGDCPGGQGGGIKCLPKDRLLDDLKSSRNKLGGSTVFAYPFYEYNEYSISILKEAGFTMAFVGESTRADNLIHVGSDKFRLPRFVVVDYTSMKDLDEYFDIV